MDATPLDALLPPPGGAPQSAPPLPSSTTYTPVVTPGTMQYYGSPQATAQNVSATPYVKQVLRSIVQYIAVFIAAFVLSLPAVQTLGLRYVPSSYTSGGLLSMTGAGVVGIGVVILSYVLSTVLTPVLI